MTITDPQAARTSLAMKPRNPLAAWLGLPLITGGIYSLVWYFKIHKEMANFDPRRDIKPGAILLTFLLVGWTVVGALICLHRTGVRIKDAQRSAGIEQTCSPVTGTLLMLLGGFGVFYYQSELNKVTATYQVEPGSAVTLRV